MTGEAHIEAVSIGWGNLVKVDRVIRSKHPSFAPGCIEAREMRIRLSLAHERIPRWACSSSFGMTMTRIKPTWSVVLQVLRRLTGQEARWSVFSTKLQESQASSADSRWLQRQEKVSTRLRYQLKPGITWRCFLSSWHNSSRQTTYQRSRSLSFSRSVFRGA